MTTPEPVQVREGNGLVMVAVPLENLYDYVYQCINHPGMSYGEEDEDWMLGWARGFHMGYRVPFDQPLSQSINNDFHDSLSKEIKRRRKVAKRG